MPFRLKDPLFIEFLLLIYPTRDSSYNNTIGITIHLASKTHTVLKSFACIRTSEL